MDKDKIIIYSSDKARLVTFDNSEELLNSIQTLFDLELLKIDQYRNEHYRIVRFKGKE